MAGGDGPAHFPGTHPALPHHTAAWGHRKPQPFSMFGSPGKSVMQVMLVVAPVLSFGTESNKVRAEKH